MFEEFENLKVKKLTEGKTKVIYELERDPNTVLIYSKDRITAGDGARCNVMEGKAEISTATNVGIYRILKEAGLRSHLVKGHCKRSFIARKCHMIPIEFVSRRVATGSFLKRNPGVPEGFKFYPLKQEFFYKNDEQHDPQWSEEQIISAKIKCGDVTIEKYHVDLIQKTAQCVFEVLERAWFQLNCTLVDMKVEFGIDSQTNEVLLADIIDSDSWRLWPQGDRKQMKDKQVYRELATVTQEALDQVKKNFQWVADKVVEMREWRVNGLIVVLLGSKSDMKYGEAIKNMADKFKIPCHIRITSAHKSPDLTLKVISEYEALGTPVVLVAIAGRSNGLGPVVSGNTTLPTINCPPLSSDWGAQDVWSSLRLPSGLSCATVVSTDTCFQHALTILSLSDFKAWACLRVHILNNWLTLLTADHQSAVRD